MDTDWHLGKPAIKKRIYKDIWLKGGRGTGPSSRGKIKLKPNIWGSFIKPAIQVDPSAHVIMKLSSFIIPPHLLLSLKPKFLWEPLLFSRKCLVWPHSTWQWKTAQEKILVVEENGWTWISFNVASADSNWYEQNYLAFL